MNLSRRRVRFRFQSFYVYSTWYLNQFEFYKRRSAVLKSQSIIEQLRCTDFYKFLNVWLFLNDWLFLNVLMFDHPPTHPPPYDPPPLKCSIPHSYLIRARSTAHSKIFLYKSFFKGLYYTLSHTYNAYIYVCSFPFFYCQIWFTFFFFWKLLCIALSVLQIYSAVCKLSLYTCQGYIHHVSFEGIHCLEKLFLSSKICLNIRNYLWNLRKWHYSV